MVDPAGIELTTSRLRQLRQLPVVQHVRFTPLKSRQKCISNDMPVAALDNWQPVWNAQVSISTTVCVNFELLPGAGDIHFCWFNFDALAQGNAYKPTKEPINYRGPGGVHTYIHTYIHTYTQYTQTHIHTNIFLVVNFDALAQASDVRIERRQVVFFCWMQNSNPRSQTPIRQQA